MSTLLYIYIYISISIYVSIYIYIYIYIYILVHPHVGAQLGKLAHTRDYLACCGLYRYT